jgi:murein DD-endopeptidase MepM/ murein hydrolase activator NlpD
MNRPSRSGRLRAASLALLACLLLIPFTAASARPAAPRQQTPTTSLPPNLDDGDSPQLGAEYNEALAQEKKLQEDLSKDQAEAREASKKLLDLQTKTRNTQIELLGAQDAYRKATAVAELRDQARKVAEKRAARALARLRHQAVASYVRGGQTSLLEAVLASRSGREAGQALAYGNAALGDSDQLLRDVRTTRDRVRKEARAAKRARAQAAKTRKDIATATVFLVSARDRQRKLVDVVNLKVTAVNASLLEVQTKKLLVQGKIDGGGGGATGGGIGNLLSTLQATQPNYQLGAVDILPPIPNAKPSSPFGIRFHPILHVYRLHAGCDIGSPTGTEIHAAADGVVVMAQVIGGYGNGTVIDHGNSLATLYGHQSQILVHVGQIVKKGDVIGRVGSTGLSTGPHLHFETRIKGIPVDPEGIVDFNVILDPKDPYAPTTTTTTP